MRKIKLNLAKILSFIMLISLVLGNFSEKVVKASQGGYDFYTIENRSFVNYLSYGNKMILAYESTDNESSKKLTISSVENGKETIINEIEGSYSANLTESKVDNVILLDLLPYGEEAVSYKKVNLSENKVYDITEEEYKSLQDNVEEEEKVWSDGEKEEVLQKINKRTGLNLTIKDKKLEYINEYYSEYVNGNERIGIELGYRNSEKSVIEFYVRYTNENENEHYSGLVFGDYVFIRSNKINLYPTYTVSNGDLYIFTESDEEFSSDCEIIKVTKEGKESHKSIDEITNNSYMEVNGEYIYIGHYVKDGYIPKLNIYKLNGNSYALVNTIHYINRVLSLDGNNSTFLRVNDEKLEIAKLKGADIEVLYDVSSILGNASELNGILFLGIEENYVLGYDNKIIVMQKNNSNQPSKPENPENNDNVVIKPSEDKVLVEVSKINPNEKNEININTEFTANNVEVVINDVESLKKGTGSLNINVNNGVELNLPLAIIDKALLDGAKSIAVKLDILENSYILNDVKGVNKVFDFNLIVNKEEGSTFIHNFKDGQAEVTLNLTDKDLEGLNKDNIVVYYYNDAEKKFEAMETNVEDNKVTFKTSHFSKYVIAEKIEDNAENIPNAHDTNSSNNAENKNETSKGTLPNTGAVLSSNIILIIALGLLLIGRAMFIRRKKTA
ncbi:MAG: LPXTG cell wall anchor domain-containing protein [Clostridium celatum]|nr:LPXTG cell wall anchor domain-containing protein [Clostridium celatum]